MDKGGEKGYPGPMRGGYSKARGNRMTCFNVQIDAQRIANNGTIQPTTFYCYQLYRLLTD